jgi:hypothetical protein
LDIRDVLVVVVVLIGGMIMDDDTDGTASTTKEGRFGVGYCFLGVRRPTFHGKLIGRLGKMFVLLVLLFVASSCYIHNDDTL